jgi:hypothetical protein
VAAVAVIWVAIVAIGFALRRALLRTELSEPLADSAVAVGVGITGYGVLVILVGTAHLLRTGPLVGVAGIAVCPLWWVSPDVVATARGLGRSLISSLRREWVVVIPVLLFLAVVVLAGFRPPEASDEIA